MVNLPIIAEEVSSIAQVETLRIVRNACTGTYAHFNGRMSYGKQQAWWQSEKARRDIHVWLYYYSEPIAGEAYPSYVLVGFGMVREDDHRVWWNSIGVLPDYRGCGYGSYITSDVARRRYDPIYAAVRRDNPAGIQMHKASDWRRLKPSEIFFDHAETERLVYFESLPLRQ